MERRVIRFGHAHFQAAVADLRYNIFSAAAIGWHGLSRHFCSRGTHRLIRFLPKFSPAHGERSALSPRARNSNGQYPVCRRNQVEKCDICLNPSWSPTSFIGCLECASTRCACSKRRLSKYDLILVPVYVLNKRSSCFLPSPFRPASSAMDNILCNGCVLNCRYDCSTRASTEPARFASKPSHNSAAEYALNPSTSDFS
jgi:hypothetical protein